jgi:hypothetical protein
MYGDSCSEVIAPPLLQQALLVYLLLKVVFPLLCAVLILQMLSQLREMLEAEPLTQVQGEICFCKHRKMFAHSGVSGTPCLWVLVALTIALLGWKTLP